MCGGTGCHSLGSAEVRKAFAFEVDKRELKEEVQIVETGCNGFCAQGPIVVIYPEGIIYMQVAPEDAAEVIEEHILKGGRGRRSHQEPVTEGHPLPRYPLLRRAGTAGAAQPGSDRSGTH